MKIRLVQCYEVHCIHNNDTICRFECCLLMLCIFRQTCRTLIEPWFSLFRVYATAILSLFILALAKALWWSIYPTRRGRDISFFSSALVKSHGYAWRTSAISFAYICIFISPIYHSWAKCILSLKNATPCCPQHCTALKQFPQQGISDVFILLKISFIHYKTYVSRL